MLEGCREATGDRSAPVGCPVCESLRVRRLGRRRSVDAFTCLDCALDFEVHSPGAGAKREPSAANARPLLDRGRVVGVGELVSEPEGADAQP
jgi:transposase-like protein